VIYQAGHIFLVARRAYERSIDEWSEAMPSIILSTVALECFVNESVERLSKKLFQEPGKPFRATAQWLEFVESKKGSTLEKIEALHLSLTGDVLDRGGRQIQDLRLMFQLRNELVHRKPESFGNWEPNSRDATYEPHKFVRELAQRRVVPLPPPDMPPIWSRYVLCDSTAKWAYNASVSGVNFIVDLIPDSNLRVVTKMMTDHIQVIA